jgi:hypothetical protein
VYKNPFGGYCACLSLSPRFFSSLSQYRDSHLHLAVDPPVDTTPRRRWRRLCVLRRLLVIPITLLTPLCSYRGLLLCRPLPLRIARKLIDAPAQRVVGLNKTQGLWRQPGRLVRVGAVYVPLFISFRAVIFFSRAIIFLSFHLVPSRPLYYASSPCPRVCVSHSWAPAIPGRRGALGAQAPLHALYVA